MQCGEAKPQYNTALDQDTFNTPLSSFCLPRQHAATRARKPCLGSSYPLKHAECSSQSYMLIRSLRLTGCLVKVPRQRVRNDSDSHAFMQRTITQVLLKQHCHRRENLTFPPASLSPQALHPQQYSKSTLPHT